MDYGAVRVSDRDVDIDESFFVARMSSRGRMRGSRRRSMARFPTRAAVNPAAGARLALRYVLRRKIARKRANPLTSMRRGLGMWPMRGARGTGVSGYLSRLRARRNTRNASSR